MRLNFLSVIFAIVMVLALATVFYLDFIWQPRAQIVSAHELPVFRGNPTLLTRLTYSKDRSPEPSPGIRGGASRVEALIPIYFQQILSSGSDLPGGWRMDVRGLGCTKASITLTRASSEIKQRMILAKKIERSFFDRLLACTGPSGVVYNVIVANSRYFAFRTAGPAWVFFDRQSERFLPHVLLTESNGLSNLFVDDQGQMYLDMSRMYARVTAREAVSLNNIFVIQLGGELLAAPISSPDWDWVTRYNAHRDCLVAQDMGRPCEAGAPVMAPVSPN